MVEVFVGFDGLLEESVDGLPEVLPERWGVLDFVRLGGSGLVHVRELEGDVETDREWGTFENDAVGDCVGTARDNDSVIDSVLRSSVALPLLDNDRSCVILDRERVGVRESVGVAFHDRLGVNFGVSLEGVTETE